MSENEHRYEDQYANALRTSFFGLLREQTGLSFRGIIDSTRKQMPHHGIRAISGQEWELKLKDLTTANAVKLFDSYNFVRPQITSQDDIKIFDGFRLAANRVFTEEQLSEIERNSHIRTTLLADINSDNTVVKCANKLGIPYYDVLAGRSYQQQENVVYQYSAKSIEMKRGQHGSERKEQGKPRNFDQMRNSFVFFLNKNTDLNFHLLYGQGGADLTHTVEQSDWNYIMVNSTDANKIKLHDIYQWVRSVNSVNPGMFMNKPNLEFSLGNLALTLSNHFNYAQENYLNSTSNTRIRLLATDDEQTAKNICLELGFPYEYIKDQPYSEVEAIIYVEAEGDLANIRHDKNEREEERQESNQNYQRPPKQENERQKPQGEFSVTNLIKDIPPLSNEVYKTFRGGGHEAGRRGIKDFDRMVLYLFKTGKFHIDEPSHQVEALNPDDIQGFAPILKSLIDNWGSGEIKAGDVIARELATSAERIYMEHIRRTKLPRHDNNHHEPGDLAKFFGASAGAVLKNPGVVLGLGLILTENTRKSFVKPVIENGKQVIEQGKLKVNDEIRSAFRKISQTWHPDKWVQNPYTTKEQAEEKFKDINEAYSLLKDEQGFRKYSAL